ncbi:TMEM175 family protein [Deinococcus rubellus]|uniref:TMEM175 family protein n=1 Tax=Deinococcus rubellus TaxID=1889240 RepID=A0ABY5YET2_9DEIO|nr:TMEM175 family protein [Deinococcus rubellus]UWX63585.1 TMEM175 family protein [Deinococcus rubellus]
MNKSRIEAFSDGVLAIIITIMVLELKAPEGHQLGDLLRNWPKFLAYVISFVYVGIYWNNHHHLFVTVKRISGAVMWANLHLLFWLSLLPVLTAWAGESHFAAVPMGVYALDLLLCGVAFALLQQAIIRADPGNTLLADAVEGGLREKLSTGAYIVAALLPLFGLPGVYLSGLLLIGVALMWIVPDRRIERVLADGGRHDRS